MDIQKLPNETLKKWDRKIILGDIVKVIRQFQPDIILTRFSKTQGGHGHHLASAILAEEAFYAAADPNQFPEQLTELKTWQAKRLLWNTFLPTSKAIKIDVGEYNPIIGKSFTELAAESRSMHKTQGFGVSPGRGSQIENFDYFAGDTAKTDIFENINLTWTRIPGGKKIQSLIITAMNNYNPENPGLIVPDLIKIYNQLNSLNEKYWTTIKKEEVKKLIKMCCGLWLESITWEQGVSPGDEIDVRSMIVNRSNIPITVKKVITNFSQSDTIINKPIEENKPFSIKETILIPSDADYTQPYWLKEQNNGNMFSISDPKLIGLAENQSALTTKFYLIISGTEFQFNMPVRYRHTDAVEGEQFKPFIIRPELSIKIDQPTYVFVNGNTHNITVHLETKKKNLTGNLSALITGRLANRTKDNSI